MSGRRVFFLQGPTALLNPLIDADLIVAAYTDDAEAARSEWGGEFRADISSYLSDDLIDSAIVDVDRFELPCHRDQGYHAFVDVSGGVSDASVLAIAHQDQRTQHLILDQLIRVPSPHKPHDVVDRFAATLQRFYIRELTGDRYGAGWVQDAFRQVGIKYVPSELSKSEIYVEAAHLFAEHRVELLNDKTLIAELRGLERRPAAGGRADRIDHAARGAHDDSANACAGALWLASTRKARPKRYSLGDRQEVALM